MLIVIELDAEGLFELPGGAPQPDAACGAIFVHEREAMARREAADLVHGFGRGGMRVEVLLAGELAAFERDNIEWLRALEHHRYRDLLRGRGFADVAAVARRGVVTIGKRDESHLTVGGHERSLF